MRDRISHTHAGSSLPRLHAEPASACSRGEGLAVCLSLPAWMWMSMVRTCIRACTQSVYTSHWGVTPLIGPPLGAGNTQQGSRPPLPGPEGAGS